MSTLVYRRVCRQSQLLSSLTRRGTTNLNYTAAARARAVQPISASKIISDTVNAEGGPQKGSETAHIQSQVTRERNFEQAAQEAGEKMQATPEAVTSEHNDAAHLKSREARATGQAQPPKDSISAEAESLAAVNEGGTKLPIQADIDPAVQSAKDREENFEQAAAEVARQMATHPENVTQEEASLPHSREHRAFGETAKGGIASQAQSLASENEKKDTV